MSDFAETIGTAYEADGPVIDARQESTAERIGGVLSSRQGKA